MTRDNKQGENKRSSAVSTRVSTPVGSLKDNSLSMKKSFERKPIVATTSYSRPQSMNSSPSRSTPIANQLSQQRQPSGVQNIWGRKTQDINVGGVLPASSSSAADLSSVGLMVSSMTLHHRPSSRNSKSSRDHHESATHSKSNSRSGTPTRRRSSGYGQTSRRNSKQGNKTFWSGNEEFYFPDGTQDELGKEEMEWIAQASSIDEKFYIKATAPPKVHVVLKKVNAS